MRLLANMPILKEQLTCSSPCTSSGCSDRQAPQDQPWILKGLGPHVLEAVHAVLHLAGRDHIMYYHGSLNLLTLTNAV